MSESPKSNLHDLAVTLSLFYLRARNTGIDIYPPGISQPCATTTTVNEPATLNVEVFSNGALPPDPSPMLVGSLYTVDGDGGRVPIRGIAVTSVLLGAYTWTDAAGRFAFCRMPSGAVALTAEMDCHSDYTVTRDATAGANNDFDLTECFR
jgi:hypothetical protein